MSARIVRGLLFAVWAGPWVLAAGLCHSADNNAGTAGAAFLKIGEGARPAALGEAVTAVVDDVNAVAWNPAGLSKVPTPQFTAVQTQWLKGYDHSFVAGAYPMSWGVLGLSFTSLTVDGIEQRSGDTDQPDGTFSSNDAAYNLSYGKGLGDSWSLGGGVNLIRESLAGVSASAVSGNLGVQWKAASQPLSLGAAVRQLGSKIKFNREGDPLPTVAALGTGYRFLDDRLRVSADVRYPLHDKMSYGAGVELTRPLGRSMSGALRAGYNSAATDPSGGMVGVTAGLGVTWKCWGFDMAWAPYGNLGQTFRYALLVKF
jgi:long-subunit fatty acid transport protein